MWLLGLDAGTEKQLPMPSRHVARGGTFSPDGTMIDSTIWLLRIDGSPRRVIGSGNYASLDIQRRAN